jgi:hypothetical protein
MSLNRGLQKSSTTRSLLDLAKAEKPAADQAAVNMAAKQMAKSMKFNTGKATLQVPKAFVYDYDSDNDGTSHRFMGHDYGYHDVAGRENADPRYVGHRLGAK